MHVVEALVDVREVPVVGDVFIHLHLAGQVVWKMAQLTKSTVDTTKSLLPSTSPGNSVRPLTPPKAEPRHVRPVTSWNLSNVSEELYK